MKISEIQATAVTGQVQASAAETGRVRTSAGTRTVGSAAGIVAPVVDEQREPRSDSGLGARLDGHGTATDDAVNADEVREMARSIEQTLSAKGVSLKFRVLNDQDTVQVEVVDPETDKVVRKIPSDDLIKLAANLREQSGGLLNKMF